jgi:hypothetical protein
VDEYKSRSLLERSTRYVHRYIEFAESQGGEVIDSAGGITYFIDGDLHTQVCTFVAENI